MPWSGKTFSERHNHSLHGKAADKAAAQATAMVRAGVPEGEAIATANKSANKSKPKGWVRKSEPGPSMSKMRRRPR